MHSTTKNHNSTIKLKFQVLIPFAFACLFLFAISLLGIYQEEKKHRNADFQDNITAIEESYANLVRDSVNKLSLALLGILENREMLAALHEKSRDKLLTIMQPIFEQLRTKHHITHLYFYNNQRNNFLRMHQPEQYGDTINRFNLLQAEKSGQLASGAEIGTMGSLTVRVVMPLWDGDKQIGYIELGEEIERKARELASMFRVKLVLLVSKDFLTQKEWESGMRMMNRPANWDQFEHSVVSLVAPPNGFPVDKLNNFIPPHLPDAGFITELDIENRLYQAAFIPVIDAGSRHIGSLLVLKDFTSRAYGVHNTVFFISMVALIIGLTLLIMFYFILDQAEKQLAHRQQKIIAATQAKLEIQKAYTAEIERQSLHDALTGLPNRKNLDMQLNQLIQGAEEGDPGYVLMLMDVDRMREINDTLGHDIGDRVLQEVGQRLHDGMADAIVVACLGGNEFAVLLPAPPPELMGISVKRIKELFSIPITVDGIALPVEVTTGVARFPEHGNVPLLLIRCADVAMRQAKALNKRCELYNSNLDNYSVRRLTLVSELRQAIDTGGLMVYYQPQINTKTGRLEGVEALARWDHPGHGFIGPEEFIPLAERTGLIGSLTQWVMQEALTQCAAWMQGGLNIKMSINISAHNLIDLSLPSTVAALLKQLQLAPEKLVLEVTESVFMLDPESSLIVLDELKALGIVLSIDDYGTGYSSLSYLKKMPVHELKIDQGFIFDMLVNENDAMIVSSTVALAHSLGLSVVAEGVETEEAWHYLQKLGCDTIQGYFVSAPLPADTFLEWLNESAAYDPRIET